MKLNYKCLKGAKMNDENEDFLNCSQEDVLSHEVYSQIIEEYKDPYWRGHSHDFGAPLKNEHESLLLYFIQNGSIQACYVLGQFEYSKGNLGRAKEFLMMAVERGHKSANISLGRIEQREGNLEKAKKYYLEAYKQGNVYACTNLGRIEEELGNRDEAIKYYTISSNANDLVADFKLVQILGQSIKCRSIQECFDTISKKEECLQTISAEDLFYHKRPVDKETNLEISKVVLNIIKQEKNNFFWARVGELEELSGNQVIADQCYGKIKIVNRLDVILEQKINHQVYEKLLNQDKMGHEFFFRLSEFGYYYAKIEADLGNLEKAKALYCLNLNFNHKAATFYQLGMIAEEQANEELAWSYYQKILREKEGYERSYFVGVDDLISPDQVLYRAGLISLNRGEKDKAKRYFIRAAAAGNKEASERLTIK
jgi:tetratricopeptide (TPR) repeat protein